MLNHIVQIIEKESVISPCDHLLLGVSGGVDSMVLFDILYRLNYHISIAHCNFSLRGEDSVSDMELVERVATQRGVPFYKVVFDTQKEMSLRGLSLQQTARELRYEWFDSLVGKHGFDKVAIAHNQDDNIETFFINMVRGTGIRGLLGIPVTNKTVVRPIMTLSRGEIMNYAKEYKVEYREDLSNATTKYLRNKIRHEIVPRFRECSPTFDTTMVENMNHLKSSAALIDSMIEYISSKSVYQYPERTDIDMDVIWSYPCSETIFFEILRSWSFGFDLVQTIIKAYSQNFSGRWFYSKNHKALLNRTILSVYDLDFKMTNEEILFCKTDCRVVFNDTEFLLELKGIDEIYSIQTDRDTALFDFDKLSDQLLVRYWRSADEFVPFGMKGHKKLSDFFVDQKLSLVQKSHTPILFSGKEVTWVVGMRIDDRFKISDQTNRVLCCRVVSFLK